MNTSTVNPRRVGECSTSLKLAHQRLSQMLMDDSNCFSPLATVARMGALQHASDRAMTCPSRNSRSA
jgi:hypothetical protein